MWIFWITTLIVGVKSILGQNFYTAARWCFSVVIYVINYLERLHWYIFERMRNRNWMCLNKMLVLQLTDNTFTKSMLIWVPKILPTNFAISAMGVILTEYRLWSNRLWYPSFCAPSPQKFKDLLVQIHIIVKSFSFSNIKMYQSISIKQILTQHHWEI